MSAGGILDNLLSNILPGKKLDIFCTFFTDCVVCVYLTFKWGYSTYKMLRLIRYDFILLNTFKVLLSLTVRQIHNLYL